MTEEFYEVCRKQDEEWNGIKYNLYSIDDSPLLNELYAVRLADLEWRIKEYEKIIQS